MPRGLRGPAYANACLASLDTPSRSSSKFASVHGYKNHAGNLCGWPCPVAGRPVLDGTRVPRWSPSRQKGIPMSSSRFNGQDERRRGHSPPARTKHTQRSRLPERVASAQLAAIRRALWPDGNMEHEWTSDTIEEVARIARPALPGSRGR